MIIVLFHALYLLGKYVYDNFHPRIDKTEDIKPAVQLLNVTEADYRDPMKSEHIAEDEQNFVVKFFPPVYVQRYTTVLDVLASPQYSGKIKKVIDFGCAELSFAVLLKNAGIEEIYCVDIDRSLLESVQSKVAPLHCDYLSLRTEPLSIHVCEGSIAHNDKKLEHTDAVICIELIEHLYPDDLDAFPHNVFGFIKPQVAIVTTPNADFNVLFKDLNGFRHADHKFEWTRTQFQDWANNIVVRYPDYEVSFHGIGSGPGGTEHLGSCSQMAVFHRHSELYDERPEGVDGLLKTVVSHKYPYRVDNRSDEEKILDEAVYYIRLYSARDEEYSEEIPLKRLMFSVEKFRISVEILKSILEEANWGIVEREDGPVVLIPPQSTFSTYSGADFDDFLETDYRHNGDDNDWDTLEQGAPQSGYLFDTYMEGDPWDNEEGENWDDPTQDTLNSENLPNSELLDSQWTMEDLNNEDPPIDASLQPQDTTSRSFGPDTELPSDSLSIGLDPSDLDYLNVSIGTIDLSEHDLSSTQSLGTESRLVSNENSALPHNSSKEYLRCEGSTCTERSDGPIVLQHPENENQDRFDIPTTESERYKCTLKDDVRPISEEAASSCPQDVAEIDETDCNSVCNESSSVSTIEATCLLSHEQSLVDEKDEESLRNDQSIDTTNEKRFTSLSENDEYYDMCSMNIQPSCISDNSLYAQHEISNESTRDSSSDRNESYKNLDISYDSIDSNYQKSEADLIRIQKLRSEETKSQDSMSFKSISDSNLDLKPKYTSSPQVRTNGDKIQERNRHEDRRLLDEQNRKSTFSASQNEQKTVQSLDIKDTDFGNEHDSEIKRITTAALESQNDENVSNKEYLSEGVKIDENDSSNIIEKVSPNTSQLSLQSNSDISLSTATSTGSSNVEKWYSAEANPMYRRDLVALKGGNDTADNPSDETSDSDVTSVLETSLETSLLVAVKTDSDVRVKSMRMVNDFQNTSRQRPFFFSAKYSDDDEHQAEQLCDLRPFGRRTQTRNEDLQTLDVSGGISICKPTTSIGASAPCNVSKIGEERSQFNNDIDVGRGFENAESNQFSPESLDTPPNSWSPEIMDSGYPNSASVHDSTPEYELSSIANDKISDSDSASIEDMPLPAAYEFLEVENGDLANNNRDDEGNNVIAFQADDLDDLQPLIDVLENDMENENDIYVLQNGFPMWLLRILEMANPIDLEGIGGQQAQLYPAPLEQAGGDAGNVNAENDEGFDSSSSEDESDVDDDEADDATTVSSDDEHSAENVRDWRAGGDP